ncbi:polysaccharide biosynthesis/export family protein [Pseudomonas sp. GD04058]|uniref:polysaccharide biosynthesis/export family protein n=1 Tax=Pseudomonas sp. GD04058 TaxID=2975429 RepID=UPI00244D133E|nr:polysaccharide biosynthesis/export family protein [Pseudomonas sp. GD04058]MDG9882505.1 polysaccharide biosynthesis/export family protein [Pseudomonas sp. GD04058]
MNTPLIALFALVPLLAACSSNQEMHQMPVQIMTAPAAGAQATELESQEQVLRPQDVLDVIFHIATSGTDAYRIQPGDTIGLNFLSASSLNGNQLVLPDGRIELPAANTSVQVAGLTSDQARAAIQQAYRNKSLFQPNRDQLTVQVISPLTNEQNLKNALNHPATGLSREITVNSDGRANFPEVGSVALQGMTVSQLEAYLNERYAKLPGKMSVDVMLKSTAVNEIYVLGEVGAPGAYPIRRPVSVLEALTLARGPSIKARLDSVMIMRRKGNQVTAVPYNIDQALDASAQQVAYLQPDDMLYVPKTKLASAGELARQLADVVLFQGFGMSFSYRLDNKGSDN